ncbi:MAG: hypothetical protein GOVbin2066_39 [Prokaryotic dsDNA virus sp.]|nr:MAG: hypothetical protein GOVbin2066_39 [Prokaryotic dsDNA virus sp.]|tara:strand:+ start:1162 stop:1386 length:225 start_codon:yes stop_codon:yes gene_type:complete
MPSLDGYSLNEEIKKLRKEIFEELASQREAFRELYGYLAAMQKKEKAESEKKAAIRKETKNAKSKKMRANVPQG